MTIDQFWKLIGCIDVDALDEGDEDAAVEPLENAMRSLTSKDLEDFEEHLSRTLHAIDGCEFARHAGDSGDSDDGFLYARCYVVAKGHDYYQRVLEDPRLMPHSIDQWCEALLYPHRHVWANSTGNDEADWAFDASVSYESGSNELLWKE